MAIELSHLATVIVESSFFNRYIWEVSLLMHDFKHVGEPGLNVKDKRGLTRDKSIALPRKCVKKKRMLSSSSFKAFMWRLYILLSAMFRGG